MAAPSHGRSLIWQVRGSGFLGFAPPTGDPAERVRIRLKEGKSLPVKQLTDTSFFFDAPAMAEGCYTLSFMLNLQDWVQTDPPVVLTKVTLVQGAEGCVVLR